MKLKVGKYYLSNGNGILKCIAERNEVFIVENDDCCYYVDSKGIALYLNEFGDYEEYDDRPDLDLVCEVVSPEEDYNLQYNCTEEGTPVIDKTTKHSHYFKDVSKLEKIDVYTILSLYEVTDPCIQHTVKKLLCTGKRGHKDFLKDVQDSIDSLVRCIELNKELSK